jgi:hypothetical protein
VSICQNQISWQNMRAAWLKKASALDMRDE